MYDKELLQTKIVYDLLSIGWFVYLFYLPVSWIVLIFCREKGYEQKTLKLPKNSTYRGLRSLMSSLSGWCPQAELLSVVSELCRRRANPVQGLCITSFGCFGGIPSYFLLFRSAVQCITFFVFGRKVFRPRKVRSKVKEGSQQLPCEL